MPQPTATQMLRAMRTANALSQNRYIEMLFCDLISTPEYERVLQAMDDKAREAFKHTMLTMWRAGFAVAFYGMTAITDMESEEAQMQILDSWNRELMTAFRVDFLATLKKQATSFDPSNN